MNGHHAWLISASLSALALPAVAHAQSGPSAAGQQAPASGDSKARSADAFGIDEIVVTAQKRQESLQDVPIAVSALNEDSLRERGIDGAGNLVQTVPNLVFQKRSVRSSLQIRGVGAQVVSVAGDEGVGVHTNNAPLSVNRLGEGEFYDIERVEVLRGPQGTLYGRSATGGVINIITNKPTDTFSAEASLEVGNYGTMRGYGHINLPIAEGLGLRVAGLGLSREGYTTNLLTGTDIDGRGLWSGRATLGYDAGAVRAFALWEGFREDDSRGARKQLCLKDPGPATVGGVATGVARSAFSQGCQPRSVYADDVYGATNTLATFAGILGRQLGIQPADSFSGKTISRDLREVEVVGQPRFIARSDVYQFGAEWDFADGLTISSLTGYSKHYNYARGDTTGGYPTVTFPSSPLVPTGIVTSGQLGSSDRLQIESILETISSEFSQELRLESSFDGPINFNVGAIYMDYDIESTVQIGVNILDTIAAAQNRTLPTPIYIDALRDPDFSGHNYYLSTSFYDLRSIAAFGEIYYDIADDLRLTVGLRYTDDRKQLTGSGSTLMTPGRGLVLTPLQEESFRALTGRVNLSYSPDLGFTDDTLIYLSAARGYKGGGFNTPGVVALGLPARFEPEFVNGIELGTKNRLADGRVTLNLTGFYYDYSGYQISRSVNRATFVENVNSRIAGLEFEGAVEVARGFRLNANVGYLDTEITEGQAVDSFYRTQGDPAYVYGNSTTGGCILNAAGVAAALQLTGGPAVLANAACSGTATLTTRFAGLGLTPAAAASLASSVYSFGPNVTRYSNGSGEGVLQNLSGNSLPNAPRLTISLGAEYVFELGNGWTATARGDYYRQSATFARYNNAFFDRLEPWTNVNATFTIENREQRFSVQFYVKNALDDDTITDFAINDENLGASRSLSLLDPRLFGIRLTKGF